MNERLRLLIESSKDAHVIMPYDETETTDYRLEKKPALESVTLDDCESIDNWKAITEYADVSLSSEESFDGEHSVLFRSPTKLNGFLSYRTPGTLCTPRRTR